MKKKEKRSMLILSPNAGYARNPNSKSEYRHSIGRSAYGGKSETNSNNRISKIKSKSVLVI